MDDKKKVRAEGGRRFQRQEPATEMDLDLVVVVLIRETESSHLSRGRRGRVWSISVPMLQSYSVHSALRTFTRNSFEFPHIFQNNYKIIWTQYKSDMQELSILSTFIASTIMC